MISWLLVAAAFADIVSMEALQACPECPEGQETRSCNLKRGECAALKAAGWDWACNYGNGDRYCRGPDAVEPGPPQDPRLMRMNADRKFEHVWPRPEPYVDPPLGDAPTPAQHPAEEAAEAAAAEARAAEEAAAAAPIEASGCGCSSARWTPGVGLLLLIAAGARRREPGPRRMP